LNTSSELEVGEGNGKEQKYLFTWNWSRKSKQIVEVMMSLDTLYLKIFHGTSLLNHELNTFIQKYISGRESEFLKSVKRKSVWFRFYVHHALCNT